MRHEKTTGPSNRNRAMCPEISFFGPWRAFRSSRARERRLGINLIDELSRAATDAPASDFDLADLWARSVEEPDRGRWKGLDRQEAAENEGNNARYWDRGRRIGSLAGGDGSLAGERRG